MIGSFVTTTRPHTYHVSCRVFWWNIKSPRWLSPSTAQIWHVVTSGFSQTKSTFESEEISDHWWDSGRYDRAADWGLGEVCDFPRCLLWRGLRHHCPMYNVSCILFYFLTVVQVKLSPFSPHHCPTHLRLPLSNPPPLALSMCPLYMFFDGPSPISPPSSFFLSPLVTGRLFFISMSLVIFCLLVLLIRFHL